MERDSSFAHRFPELHNLVVEAEEQGRYHHAAFTYVRQTGIPCHDPRCRGGDLDLGPEIRRMIQDHQTTSEVTLICSGSVDYSAIDIDCSTHITCKILIQFKEY